MKTCFAVCDLSVTARARPRRINFDEISPKQDGFNDKKNLNQY